MSPVGILGLIALVAIVVVAIWVTIGSRKKRWYKVFLANNEVMLLYRDLNERWWRTSDRYMRFKDEFGREVTFPAEAHWIIRMEEVPDAEVSAVREQLYQMRERELAREREN